MAANYVLLERFVIGSAGATSITFTNIPQTGYTDLIIKISARKIESGGGTNIQMRFNGSTSGYAQRTLIGNGSAANSYNDGSEIGFMYASDASRTANTFSSTEITIPNYTLASNKAVSIDNVIEQMGTSSGQVITNANWANNDPISSVYIQVGNGTQTFGPGTTFAIYGVAAFGTTPEIAPKATGGDIVQTDGTYYYHAFLSSGTFTPYAALTCDYLVVAGGGSGGYSLGSGGGAGGFRASASNALTATAYTVVVGAGGTGTEISESAGSDSSFNSYVSTGGGRGATGNGEVGGNGGSGGGGSHQPGFTAGGISSPATSPAQGNSGGTGYTAGGPAAYEGGGGGAGGAGGNAVSGQAGNGGAGANSYNGINVSSWLSATGTGVSGLLAGGGGGANNSVGNRGAGGSGGGGQGGSYYAPVAGTAGTVNTGSGGGGGGNVNYGRMGGNGGSGIVIIRYTVA